jgi:hypothetical protein
MNTHIHILDLLKSRDVFTSTCIMQEIYDIPSGVKMMAELFLDKHVCGHVLLS